MGTSKTHDLLNGFDPDTQFLIVHEFLEQVDDVGKRDFTKEKRKYINHIAGTFIVRRCGITKIQDREVIVGWEKSILAPFVGQQIPMDPIIERQVKCIPLNPAITPMLTRVIGWRLENAVGHAMGNHWHTNHELLARANDALGVTQNKPSNQ